MTPNYQSPDYKRKKIYDFLRDLEEKDNLSIYFTLGETDISGWHIKKGKILKKTVAQIYGKSDRTPTDPLKIKLLNIPELLHRFEDFAEDYKVSTGSKVECDIVNSIDISVLRECEWNQLMKRDREFD